MRVQTTQGGEFQVGAIVPTYRHVQALPRVVEALIARGVPVVVVDDGNDAPAMEAIVVFLSHAGGGGPPPGVQGAGENEERPSKRPRRAAARPGRYEGGAK